MLDSRLKTHGEYGKFAEAEQTLQAAMRKTEGFQKLSLTQVSVLNMIQHKIARILTGSPDHLDHWRDIQGYAQRALDELQKKPGATDTKTSVVVLDGGTWK